MEKQEFLLLANSTCQHQVHRWIDRGYVNVDHEDSQGWTAMHYAVLNRHRRLAAILCQAGVNPYTDFKAKPSPRK